MLSRKLRLSAVAALVALAPFSGASAAAGKVAVTGEVIDSWCYLTEIMYPLGTAHHQCAIWCAAGGIPVGLLDDEGKVYILLSFGGKGQSVADPDVLQLQTHRITVEGEVFERDGMTYLVADRLVEDKGIVNFTDEEYGIQPFGE